MKLRYTRTFECEVSNELIIKACEESISDFYEGEADIDRDRREVDAGDILRWLDQAGHLAEEQTIDSIDEPEIDSGVFEHDFYSVDALKAELK